MSLASFLFGYLHLLQEFDAGVDMLVHNLVDVDKVDGLAEAGKHILDERAALQKDAQSRIEDRSGKEAR